ncbi:MAG: DUF58 domain-containing protein [Pseudomonadales bacterium]|nr:DUF58 domain-containing protein [Pseudomonadales bacterium]
MTLRQRWNQRIDQWMRSRIHPADSVTLKQRTIYILPSRQGLMFIFAIGLVFIAAINYAVSLAFGLAFLMISLFVLGILYTFNNLNQLTLSALPNQAVFCGDEIGFNVLLTRKPKRSHESLEICFQQGWRTGLNGKEAEALSHADLVEQDQEQIRVFTTATRRGNFKAPYLRVSSTFPLGLARAWSIVDLNLHCLVYPRPIKFRMDEFNSGSGGSDDTAISKEGSEDFYGLRDYVPGDPLRQVAWKNVARGQGMQVKQFVDYVDSKIWLDWDMFYGFSTEERLSRLCYCVLQLDKRNNPYGLKLPGVEIPPGAGPEHRARLLKALALFGAN